MARNICGVGPRYQCVILVMVDSVPVLIANLGMNEPVFEYLSFHIDNNYNTMCIELVANFSGIGQHKTRWDSSSKALCLGVLKTPWGVLDPFIILFASRSDHPVFCTENQLNEITLGFDV